MNRNRKCSNKLAAGLAVGMAAVMTAVPVYAAEETGAISKEETVYVNADASGNQESVTVSSWLKNAGSEKELKDQSDLQNITNVKGDETFTQDGENLTWNTDGADIYYQGTTDKELPVGVQLTYYLDGQEIAPEDLKGKSGHLEIHVKYTNKTQTTAKINGKDEEISNPFVLVTGMILPGEHFSNVTIDNGKVVSDGNREIVVGFGVPGLQDSLKLDDLDLSSLDDDEDETEDSTEDTTEAAAETEDSTEEVTEAATEKASDSDDETKIDLPESFVVSADVTDFSMSSTFTVALTDILSELDLDETDDFDKIKDKLNDLEDAALKLVDGTEELSDGVDTLDEKYAEFDDGVKELKNGVSKLLDGSKDLKDGVTTLKDGTSSLKTGADKLDSGAGTLKTGIDTYTKGTDQLNSGIQTYLSKKGVLSGKTGEFKKGVDTLAQGIEQYTDGASTLNDGVSAYVDGVNKLSAGASQLQPLVEGLTTVKGAIQQMNAALDGKGDVTEDINAAAQALAAGTQQLQDALDATDVQQMKTLLGTILSKGSSLSKQVTDLETWLGEQKLDEQMANLSNAVAGLNAALSALQKSVDSAAADATAEINAKKNSAVADANE